MASPGKPDLATLITVQLMADGIRGQITARAVDHVVVVAKPNTEHVPILHPLMEEVTVLGLHHEAAAVILTLAVQHHLMKYTLLIRIMILTHRLHITLNRTTNDQLTWDRSEWTTLRSKQ
ncbi:hypothetical protein QZH41_006083 [Actinostola sp. cb2023]|nr:hypothetical protein QZH41_006083 [Actinostola sp. cb2023]